MVLAFTFAVLSREEIVDSTGCGDAYVAALISFMQRSDFPEVRLALPSSIYVVRARTTEFTELQIGAMMKFASWYAAMKLKKPGARSGLLRAAQIDAFVSSV